MIDEARQVTTGLGSVIGRKISLYGLQLTIEVGLDALGRQVEAIDQGDQIADLGGGSLDDHHDHWLIAGESVTHGRA